MSKRLPPKPRWQPPLGMDPECIPICTAMNRFPGIHTYESCCGHGERPFRIWFRPDSLDDLPPLLYYTDYRHSGRRGWQVIVSTDCAMSPVTFALKGSTGPEAYEAANHVATLMEAYLDGEGL